MMKSRKPIVGTGWKMNHLAADVSDYAYQLLANIENVGAQDIDIFVLPPFTALHQASRVFANSAVAIGAQNMHWENSGAWTGEISAPMLKEAGCRYVELAHAERLAHFGETYEAVALKVVQALRHGLTPILCLGESAQDKQLGRADEVLAWQIVTALSDVAAEDVEKVVLAYEPRWAIGQPQSADPDYVTARHGHIRSVLHERFGAQASDNTRIMYGGSVSIESAPALAACKNVDGLFVGRQAWVGRDFARIVKVIMNTQNNEETRS